MARKAEKRLAEALAARDAARAALRGRAERLQADFHPAKLGRRLADDLAYRARAAAMQVLEVAGDNRGWMASAASLAGLWLARRQAGGAALALWQTLGQTFGQGWRARRAGKANAAQAEAEDAAGG